MFTFKKIISELKPSVFFCEETKFKDTGKLKIDNYVIFELVRKNRDGGGLALGCDKSLKPVWVREGDEEVEALSVDIFVKSMKIRCCVAYGCQENASITKKDKFWQYLKEDVAIAHNTDSGFILQFDGNLWAGPEIIPGDPRPQNRNGKIFENFLSENPNLTVVNSLSLCEGLITRKRLREGKLETSVLDFFVVCSRILPHIRKMVIDEDRRYILTNYTQAKNGGKAIDSDHATEYMDLDLKIIHEKPERKEMFRFKDKDAMEMFKKSTSETKEFSNCFENNLPILEQIESWRRVLKAHCSKSFKKVRISRKRFIKPLNKKISELIDKRNQLMKNNRLSNLSNEIRGIDEMISDLEAEENRNLILSNFKSFSDNPETINLQEVWKTLKKIWPKHGNALPTAKRNHSGKIVSGSSEIKCLMAKEFKERLRTRPLRPDFEMFKGNKKKIFELKMQIAEANKSPDWKMCDLESALSNLKNNKSRDHEGYINELFKTDVAGYDLKQSLLMMFNKLKKEKKIAVFMNFSNITTVPKKGSSIELKNLRGVFRVSIVRSILMRMIYNSKYAVIDSKMSDSQMGARKKKGCRNNIFILNGIIHDVMKSRNKKPVLFQLCDYEQMFDSVNLQEAISDIFEYGFNDDMLSLVYKGNQEIHMAVNTPSGQTERQTINNIVLQGDTWGSLLSSCQVDTIGQHCQQSGYGYQYKNILPISMLGLVDDIIGISEPGYKAQQMNALINVKTAEKGLRFGPSKCKSMLIGKETNAINSDLHVDYWKSEHELNLDTGEADLKETFEGLMKIEKVKEQKYLGFIISNSGNNMANISEIKKKSIGTIRSIFSRLIV